MEDFGRKFKRIDQLFKIRMNKELENLDLTLAQMHVLSYLEQHDGEKITQKQLSDDFQVKHSTMAGILQRMKEKGLVRISVDNDNKRYRNITRTEETDKIKTALNEHKNSTEKILLQGFTKTEIKNLSGYLERIYNNLINDSEIPACYKNFLNRQEHKQGGNEYRDQNVGKRN